MTTSERSSAKFLSGYDNAVDDSDVERITRQAYRTDQSFCLSMPDVPVPSPPTAQ